MGGAFEGNTAHIYPTATHGNTLQHTATHYNTLQHTYTQCLPKPALSFKWIERLKAIPRTFISLQHTATHCNTPQLTATHRNSPQLTVTHRNSPPRTATHCKTHRPSASQDPALSFKWIERFKATPRTLKHSVPEIRAKCAMRFADMTESLTEDEVHTWGFTTHCNTLQHTATRCNTLQHTTRGLST